jgi:putative transposase
MTRVRRSSLPDGYFHVYSRGLPEAPAFPGASDRNALLVLIQKCERRFDLRVLAATVMTTHYHLVVETTASTLSKAIQWLNASYARGFNARNSRFGSVFAERFSVRAVNEEDLPQVIDYVLANPLEAGLDDWPWSYSVYGELNPPTSRTRRAS